MGRFEDRLWQQIVRDHGTDLRSLKPSRKRRRRARPRLLAGTSLGLAGIAAVIAIALSAASSTPAFAVTRNNDGTVTVTVGSISAIGPANAKLSRLGLPVRLVPLTPGCGGTAAAAPVPLPAMKAARAVGRLRFDPHKIPAGKTLVLATWRSDHLVRVAPAPVVAGPPPACLPAPAAAPLPCLPAAAAPPGARKLPAPPGFVPLPSAKALRHLPLHTLPRAWSRATGRPSLRAPLPSLPAPLTAMKASCRAFQAAHAKLLKHWRLQLKVATGRG